MPEVLYALLLIGVLVALATFAGVIVYRLFRVDD